MINSPAQNRMEGGSTQGMPESSADHQGAQPSVPWSEAVRFIRQLSHDLRNDLNAIELQSTYIAELETNEQLKGEIKRLREMVAGASSALQRLSRAVAEVKPNLILYRADDFIEDLRTKIEHDFSNHRGQITWDIRLSDTTLSVDPQLLQEAFTELFGNAFRHHRGNDPVLATARTEDDRLLFTLREPKAQFDLGTQNWGREPFGKVTQRHYGLGLNRVRAIVEAHGGKLHAQYDPDASALITTLTLPVPGKSSAEA
jgi:signal transduction histidine kinase